MNAIGRASCLWFALGMATWALMASEAGAGVLYVRADAAPGGDGSSWERACNRLQDALERAKAGDDVWVAAGTYYPTDTGDHEASFALKQGVAVYGGFAGREAKLEERDWQRNPAVLSGDIGQRGDDSDNSYHVVKGADGGALDGFVISGGNCLNAAGPGAGGLNAGGPPPGGGRPGGPGRGGPGGPGRGGFGAPGGGAGGAGGGIHTTPDLVLQGGGEGAGGGMLNFQCAPEVRNCVFENNKARKGGAVYNMTSAAFPPRPGGEAKTPVFVKCVFRNNSAVMRGGGVSNDLGTAPVFLGCVFSDNETPEKGGGLYDDFGCSPLLINCLFTGNRAQSAAGMGNDGGSCPVLYHCTLTRNHAVDSGPSLYQGTGPANNPAIVRCVVWGNTCDWESPGLYNWHDCAPVVKESTIEDYAAGGAATEDPRLDGQGVSPLDCGYKPSAPHFDPARLPELLKELEPYRSKFAFEPPAQETQPPVKKSDRVVYVNGARTQKGDGASWATAFCSPTDALADAARDGAQVWVAAGVYAPEGTDRFASFTLFPGARLFGGFAGNEADPGKRDPERNRTVLSGDIGKPGEPSDNCYHVIIGADGASLDGFTISGGYADGVGYDGKGGGMINYRRGAQTRPNAPTASGYSVAVNNCIFTDNRARDGGAVYNYDRSEPRFTGCAFTNNRAENGGAVLDRVGVKAEYENCQFIGNAAQWRGGAAYFDYGSRPALSNCVFRDNQTSGHGGAIHSVSRASQLENTEIALDGCRFEGNRAHGDGGAVSLQDNSVAIARRCAFIANAAERNGGAVLAAGGSALEQDQNEFRDNKAAGDGADVYEDKSAPRGPDMGAPGGGRPGAFRKDSATPSAVQRDFSVVIIGSSGPEFNPDRAGPSALIRFKDKRFLVDMGEGAQRRLNEAGESLSGLDALIFTHHHLDHDAEFIPILIQGRLRSGARQVLGPPGTQRFVDFILDFYQEDIAYRAARIGLYVSRVVDIPVTELKGGERFDLDGVAVSTAKVNHTIYTLAYRFDVEGKSIVISGDLYWSDSLVELARGADVLVMDSGGVIMKGGPAGGESSRRPRPGALGASRPAGPASSPIQSHATLEEVARMAGDAKVKRLVLTHLRPGEVDEEASRAEIAKQFAGEVLFAKDLLEVAVP